MGSKRTEMRVKNLSVADLIMLSHKSGRNETQLVNLIVRLADLVKVDSCCETLSKIGRLNIVFDVLTQIKEHGTEE